MTPLFAVPSAAVSELIAHATGFRAALLDWYHAHRRRLPWREHPSAYRTVVSEFMLQQTQVKTMLPYFDRWMETLPDFASLAGAPESQVLKLWEGLGYYSRARNLQRLARAVTALPELPRTPEAWLPLPGVGPYTAAAVTSIAFGARVACVDGNVVRILARLTADGTPFRDSATASKAFAPLANALVSPDAPGDHNQAMMELGATVCVRQKPLCTVCPVFDQCAGRRTGAPERFPRLAPKTIERMAVARAWCLHDGRLLLHRSDGRARRFADMHEIPTLADVGLADATFPPPLLVRKRGITRYAITESFHRVALSQLPPAVLASATLVWVLVTQLEDVTLSGPHRRWSRELLSLG